MSWAVVLPARVGDSFLTPSGPISSCKASSSPDICPSAFCRALRRVPFVSSRRASAPAPSAPHPPWAGGDQPEPHVRGLPAPRPQLQADGCDQDQGRCHCSEPHAALSCSDQLPTIPPSVFLAAD